MIKKKKPKMTIVIYQNKNGFWKFSIYKNKLQIGQEEMFFSYKTYEQALEDVRLFAGPEVIIRKAEKPTPLVESGEIID